jgi:hypothetical protein
MKEIESEDRHSGRGKREEGNSQEHNTIQREGE